MPDTSMSSSSAMSSLHGNKGGPTLWDFGRFSGARIYTEGNMIRNFVAHLLLTYTAQRMNQCPLKSGNFKRKGFSSKHHFSGANC